MKRIHADILLGIVGLIWGFAFVAQKNSVEYIGAFTFSAARFLLSALCVLPFVWREGGLRRQSPLFSKQSMPTIIAMCLIFSFAAIIQQFGIAGTTVANASFLTATYVAIVPFAAFVLYRQKIVPAIFIASALALIGVWLLTGADLWRLVKFFNRGDALVLFCAIGFAVQIPILGHIVGRTRMPCTLSFLQYLAVGSIALVLALCFEHIDLHALIKAWMPIAYAGIASGGIAYTLQAVAQQHTPSADAAIISGCGEALFGALGGIWLLHEVITPIGYVGCAAILASIVLVEIIPLMRQQR